jgi:heavy metal sensor kinase
MIRGPVLATASLTGGFRSLRWRITLWYGAIIALCLVAYSVAMGHSYAAHVEAELNRRVHEDVELVARATLLDEKGRPYWPEGFRLREINEEEGGGHWLELWSVGGERLLATGTLRSLDLGLLDSGQIDGRARTLFHPFGPLRVLVERFKIGSSTFVARAAVSEIAARKEVHSLWRELATISLGVLALGGLGGFALARRSLGPLARMAEHARRITAEQLSERLSLEDSGTELNQLRDAFNDTLARLENSFSQLRRFTADASHELRTPLTALRSVGEVGLRQDRTGEEYRDVIGTMLEEVDRLSRIVDGLLTLARSDAGGTKLKIERVDLPDLASDVVDRLAVLAEERRQSLETIAEGPISVQGDRLALRQALLNLVDNAIKYAPEGTTVLVRVGQDSRGAFVEVQDQGPAISAEHRARIFERFYRVDGSRSREMGGTGLGLALVKGTAEAHGGSVELDGKPGGGNTFRLVLPLTAS